MCARTLAWTGRLSSNHAMLRALRKDVRQGIPRRTHLRILVPVRGVAHALRPTYLSMALLGH
eukprot:2245018-Alexandrium_andersonii.AAC.1